MTTRVGLIVLVSVFVTFAIVAAPQCASSEAPFAPTADGSVFLLLSDLHFDPFADPAIVCKLASSPVEDWKKIFSASHSGYPTYGSDTTYPLLASALETARSMPYDYVIVSGDFLRHHFQSAYQQAMSGCSDQDYPGFVIKTMVFLSREVQAAFPDQVVLSVLGNNDSIGGDYQIAPDSPLLAALADEWRVVAADPAAVQSFTLGGYYAVPHPTIENHEVIALNDIFWSAEYVDSSAPGSASPGQAELAWLEWTLYRLQSQQKTATLIMHIPPGVDSYGSSSNNCPDPAVTFWTPAFSQSFSALMQDYKGVVTYMFAGHTHMDDFRLLYDQSNTAYLATHITPSISPIFGNNPAFEVGLYDIAQGGLVDFAPVYLTNLGQLNHGSAPQWQFEYLFTGAYGLPSCSCLDLQQLADLIVSDPGVRKMFADYYAVLTPQGSPITSENWLYYSCAQRQPTSNGYDSCVCSQASDTR